MNLNAENRKKEVTTSFIVENPFLLF